MATVLVSTAATERASAQVASVADVRRVGSNVEDITSVDKGALNKKVVLLDGDELRVVDPASNAPATFLCDLTDAGVITDWTPRGIAWVTKTRELVVHDFFPPFHPVAELVFFDDRCEHVRRVPVTYPFPITNTEGMDYIPASSRHFRNHVASIVEDENFQARIVIFDLDGEIADIITPDAPVGTQYGLGLAYSDDGFLVTLLGVDETWRVEFDGSVSLVGPQPWPGVTEGLDESSKGFVGVEYRARLRRTDDDLVVIAGGDRSYVYGPNMPRENAVTHVDGLFVFTGGLFDPQLNAMPDDYSHNIFLTAMDPDVSQVAAPIGGTTTVLVSYRESRTIQPFDTWTSTFDDPVDVAACFPDATVGAPAFIDSTGEVLLPERGPLGRPGVLQVVDLDGTSLGEIDLATTLGITDLTSVSWRATGDPDGELVVYADGIIWITDIYGGYVAQYLLPAGVTLNQISAINDGIYAGELAGMERLDTNRLYRLAL
ncbi:MAG TPA: hypothetical protein VM261_28460 [Kofleriaceae bacterium]|nr:hypothetical protein [Kofleriaceae bacterium]